MDAVPAVGSIVEATELVMQSDLNGLKGEVVAHQEECAVVNIDGKLKALKPKNLKLVTPAFSAGMMLQAHGLKQRGELNGKVGKVINVQFSDGSTSYTVEFPSHGVIIIKASNACLPTELPAADFPPGTSVEAHSLTSEVSLNGKVGVILSHQTDNQMKGLLMVQFPAPHGTMLLKPTNLKKAQCATADFPVGAEVEARGLQSKTVINGCCGTVAGHRQGPDGTTQVIVKFPVHGTMALMPVNIKKTTDSSLQSLPTVQAENVASLHPVNSRVMAHSLQQQKSLNNVTGLVVGHQQETGHVMVQFPPEHGTHALLTKNLSKATTAPAPTPSAPTATHDPVIASALKSIRPPPLPEVACEGWLNKKTPAMGRDYDRRWFSLRGQVLVYYEEKGRISLSPAHECAASGESFILAGPGMSRKFELKADKPEQKDKWIAALKSASKAASGAQTLHSLETLETAGRYQVQCNWLAEYPKIGAKEYVMAVGSNGVANGNHSPPAPVQNANNEEVQRLMEQMQESQKRYEEEKESMQAMLTRLNEELNEARMQVAAASEQTTQVNGEEERQELEKALSEARNESAGLGKNLSVATEENTSLKAEVERMKQEMAEMAAKVNEQEQKLQENSRLNEEVVAAPEPAAEAVAAPVVEAVPEPAPVPVAETVAPVAAPAPEPVQVAAPEPVQVAAPEPVQIIPLQDEPKDSTDTPHHPQSTCEEPPRPVTPPEAIPPVPAISEPAPAAAEPVPVPVPAPAVTTDGSSAFLLAD
eukprot:TRINITY_DN229_c2_g1_i5.p1 TRINITY_DN229_c2_g1~~TRINITY_DN229_c2_g1_i5.p1  ORF type:complete len:761 (+),score=230.65 TRINITY_DN229_c2_g1_i5:54-2336(+)